MIICVRREISIHDRRVLGANQACSSKEEEDGKAALSRPRCVGGRVLGAQDRRAMAGPACPFAERVDLLAATQGLGRARGVGQALAKVHPHARRARHARLGGKLHRRQLRSGEKRGLCVGKTKRGKGTKWMVVADGKGLPVGGTLASASPAEVRLAPAVIHDAARRLGRWPVRLIADKAYDADWLREMMGTIDAQLVCPHRKGRRRPPMQDGRPLRRYRRRWKIERLFAWLGHWRRLLIRHERIVSIYFAFFKLACIVILLRHS